MSFYGNIKRVNSSPFVFDRYYSSRSEMQEKMNSDQVYVGRYVFVSYRTKYENENVVYFDKYDKDASKYEVINLTADTYTPNIFYVISETDSSKYVLATGAFNPETTYYNFIRKLSKSYEENQQRDLLEFEDTFDGTVWQKIYTKGVNDTTHSEIGGEKYILVAELNSAAPRFSFQRLSPKYFDAHGEEQWNTPSIQDNTTTEDVFTIGMPDILRLVVDELDEDFYGRELIENPAERKILLDENNEPIPHNEIMSPEHNYMKWENIRFNENGDPIIISDGNIDGKQLKTELYAFGQMISDLYDALYGVPNTQDGTGLRPFYTEDLKDVLRQYDKGLVGILSSIATEAKGDASVDSYGRQLQPGLYYYFTTKWGDASEDSSNFIENIPQIVGAAPPNGTAREAHYFIDFDSPTYTYNKINLNLDNYKNNKYYIKNDNNVYSLATEPFNENTIYYERIGNYLKKFE